MYPASENTRIVNIPPYRKIDGVLLDGYSASAIVQVYDALGKDNKEKYQSMPITKMADVAFRLLAKQGGKFKKKQGWHGERLRHKLAALKKVKRRQFAFSRNRPITATSGRIYEIK